MLLYEPSKWDFAEIFGAGKTNGEEPRDLCLLIPCSVIVRESETEMALELELILPIPN